MINIKGTLEIDGQIVVLRDCDELGPETCPRDWENIEMYSAAGDRVWRVHGMREYKYWRPELGAFVGMQHKDGQLAGITFAGFAFSIDTDTGKATFKANLK